MCKDTSKLSSGWSFITYSHKVEILTNLNTKDISEVVGVPKNKTLERAKQTCTDFKISDRLIGYGIVQKYGKGIN